MVRSPYVFHSPRPCSTLTSAEREAEVWKAAADCWRRALVRATVRSAVGIIFDGIDDEIKKKVVL